MDRIQSIQLLIRVVETGSFSKASADMGLTQPTATKHIAALEARLGARLLHRSTRGVTPTEVGLLYYDKCKRIARELEEADNLALLLQSRVGGHLRISTSVAFGRRVMTPLVLRFMREHPDMSVDLSFDDRYVNLVEQGVDVALRMGRLSDSSLGARFLGLNPWLLVASPEYLEVHGAPQEASQVAAHPCLLYSSVQGDERWTFTLPDGRVQTIPVKGPLRSNNLSAVLAACREGMGLAVLPHYVARASLADGALVPILPELQLPSQELHAVYPSPKLLPGKVQVFVSWLQSQLSDRWWERRF
ncbi:LysR family transcriptional regulator [uncultured Azohydromonas sp.]|jgi:Transcriptional regulator|uniref:LysR family transcriptional regulator n=1 Tax=uncultured Azohydromonas sp. TaxID=487342 RepID=UPI002617A3D6|nr:LysR family transcriptional regulator [uncultured Azohydromonas sp.]